MIKNIQRIIKTSLMVFSGSFLVLSCESEADNLGSQFFNNSLADGTEKGYPVIAYNVSHNDTIRTDATKLTQAVIGAFTEPQFGMQKSSYVTQLRLSSYSPDFGANAVVDSVVLVMKPVYAKDSVKTETDENYVYPIGDVPAKKVVNTYPISKYGKAKKDMTLNIHEVTDFLGASTDKVFSNKVVGTGALLGSKQISGTVSSVNVTKDADNSSLLTRDASIRIPLDKAFFQNKIVAKGSSSELSDVSNFIRYFKGLRISVAENDGYMFKYDLNALEMIMYYKRDVTANGTTTPTQTSFAFNLGSGNTHFSQIEYNRAGVPAGSVAYNTATGDSKLYTQGMGGNGIGIRIPETTIAQMRELFKTQGVGILSAKIRLYSDESVWNNNYEKPSSFTVVQAETSEFLSDILVMSSNPVFNLVKAYDVAKNPAYYDITITQTFKDIVEKAASSKDIIINVGAFETNSQTGSLLGPNYNTRAYTPNRIVLVGSDATNKNNAQLRVIYTKK